MARFNILILHDWDYNKYSNMTNENDYWYDYKEFCNTLSNYFSVYRLNLPGFCHQNDPKDKVWNIEAYADFVDKHLNNNLIDANIVLGVGFGANVAIKWKTKFKRKSKIVLVSPRLFEREEKQTTLDQVVGLFGNIGNKIKNNYEIKKEQIPELVHGNDFLQNTYRQIRNVGLFNEVIKIPPEDICIIYGAKDQEVDSLQVFNSIPIDYRARILFVNDGMHELLKTNYKEVISLIYTAFGLQ